MLIRNAAALKPRANGVDRWIGASRDHLFDPGGLEDFGVGSHERIMHNALHERKRLLHYDGRYAFCMTTPNQRLRQARVDAGYATAVDAALALGVPASTYIGHENGSRGFPAKKAPIYARKFKVTEEWLLYGKTPDPRASQSVLFQVTFPSEDVLTEMMRGMIEAAGGDPETAAALAPRLAQRLPTRLAEAQSTALAPQPESSPDRAGDARSRAKSRRASPPQRHT